MQLEPAAALLLLQPPSCSQALAAVQQQPNASGDSITALSDLFEEWKHRVVKE